MLTEKGRGMMWTLKHLNQDKVLFMEDECSNQAAVSVIEFNYRYLGCDKAMSSGETS
ncbi:hypothetical protein MTR67_030613 [Solanum verrucosum]|uniref:Uncharacterized protein n=1 Tax=Solanum verrucosum TaxID=315347 RepID=A0AAF0R9P0_SOLVR|nr:hypothetical protein MTR67_030613 [Solanum verrucosum]